MTDSSYLAHLTHGCCAKKLVLYAGEEAEFEALTAEWRAEYPPRSPLEERLLSEVIEKAWQERRCELRFFEADVLVGIHKPAHWSDQDHHQIGLFTRYKTTAERSFQRKLNQLRQVRQDRLDRLEREPPPIAPRQKEEDIVRKLMQQNIVRIVDGVTVNQVYPFNENISNLFTMLTGRVTVTRFYEFPNGVPPEYTWVFDEPPNPVPVRTAGATMNAKQWFAQIAREALHGTGHWLPLEPDEDPEDTPQ
jgi:hypothetical protein